MKNEAARARYGRGAAVIPAPKQEIEALFVSRSEVSSTRPSYDSAIAAANF